jgi:WD40 repeat protein
MKNILIVLFVLFQTVAPAQNMRDYVWIFSNNTEASEGNEAYGFDFKENQHLQSLQGLVPVQIAGLNASICDEEGNLLMYSNGCTVVDRNHEVMPNGRNLNNNDYFQMVGDSCFLGYLGLQDIMILPDPGDEDGYYILHKAVMPGNPDRFIELRYSYVDMDLNNGYGDLVEKNVVLYNNENPLWSYLTAAKHINGESWWIIQPLDHLNDYLIILLDENGFTEKRVTSIGPEFHWNASASGRAVVSPDGQLYAYYNKDDNLFLYDFDRNTGDLSNLRQLTLKTNTPAAGFFSSVEFSPNSRFLYVGVRDSLWQVDTYEQDLKEGTELIDVWDGTQDPFATTFTIMAMAPNCKIYMASGSSTNTYHVINKPNEKGLACDFVQRGIRLPHTSSLGICLIFHASVSMRQTPVILRLLVFLVIKCIIAVI